MRVLAAIMVLFGSACMSSEGHQAAFDGAVVNRQLTEERNQEMRELILSVDARERSSMDRELNLVYDKEVMKAEHRIALEMQAVTLSSESRPSLEALKQAISTSNAELAEAREKIRERRTTNTEQLNKELAMWLNDPKARQQLRIADILAVYAKTQADSAVFIEEVLGKVGVSK